MTLTGSALADIASFVLVSVTLILGYFAYRSQRGRTRLEYAVVSNARIVPKRVSAKLDVTFDGSAVPDASVVIIRIVNTGDKAILPGAFSTDLVVRLDGVQEIVSALATRTRPPDLNPALEIDGNTVQIAPLLINPEDMVELHLLASGLASAVKMEGRVANVVPMSRRSLPYSPGTGPEGELEDLFEKFMWYVAPVLVAGLVVAPIITSESARTLTRGIALLSALAFSFVLNPMYVRYLIRRRRIWAP